MKKGLLFDEPGPADAPRIQSHCRYQREEGLTGGQTTCIGEVHEFLAPVRSKRGPGLAPLLQPLVLGCVLRGHGASPRPVRVLLGVIIYDPGRFINALISLRAPAGVGQRLAMKIDNDLFLGIKYSQITPSPDKLRAAVLRGAQVVG